MNKIAVLAFTVSGLLASIPGLLQAADSPSVTVSALKGPLHLLQGRGGNVVASVGNDGVLIIDSDYAEYASAHKQALAELADGGDPRYLINTHWHGDHTGGNTFWGEQGAVILAHDNVRARMASRQDMKALNRVVEPSPAVALPVLTYGDSMTVHFNGDDIEVQHYPRGHTDGDSVVFFSSQNVVHMGDHFFKDAFPFVDVGSGGNVFGYIANIKAILARVDDATVIVPGHGAVANKADLERYYQMLLSTSSAIGQKLGAGTSVEAIASQGLGDEWASWGQGFINEAAWISFVAASR